MEIPIEYRSMQHGDESRVFTFISKVFRQFVAPGFSQQGIDAFLDYIRPEALEDRLKGNNFALIAELGSEIIGFIEVCGHNHIALFFVDSAYQRKGIGKALLRKALDICNRQEVKLSQLTVNASPNSVTAYEKLNFVPTDAEQCANGIRFVPMALSLQQTGGD